MTMHSDDVRGMVIEAIAREDLRVDVTQLLEAGGVTGLRRAFQLGLVVQNGIQSAMAVDDFLLRRHDPVTRILTVVHFWDGAVECGVSSDSPEARHRHHLAT